MISQGGLAAPSKDDIRCLRRNSFCCTLGCMQPANRPLLITLLGWLLILTGAAQFVLHAVRIHRPMHLPDLGLPLFELVILVCGIFLLRGSNVARWIAVAWIGVHICIGFLDSPGRGLIHCLIFLLLIWLLFRPGVNTWFRLQGEPSRTG